MYGWFFSDLAYRLTRYLIQVVYTDDSNDRPFDGLHEITSQNEDINSGFGGK